MKIGDNVYIKYKYLKSHSDFLKNNKYRILHIIYSSDGIQFIKFDNTRYYTSRLFYTEKEYRLKKLKEII